MSNLTPSVCIDAVFEGKSYKEAFSSVKQAGIPAIEFWSWWDKDLEALREAQIAHGLKISACCTKFISLIDPVLRQDYLQGLEDTIAVARTLDVSVLITQVGNFQRGVSRKKQRQSIIDGLKEGASMLEKAGMILVVEPLNEQINHPGYFLTRSDEAFQIIDAVKSTNVKVLFDIYHQQISEGNLIRNIVANIDKIGHFHAAGNPGRNELQRGEINYYQVLNAIMATNYNGFIGLEYWPLEADPVIFLQEIAQWLRTYPAT